ncbi:hypothetical protein L1987_31466 [Smallanthus sonchifolius]|uniref:Uncharacterized protein n=1 Tax=Smallanthus sonchifolius TaxID=185202 RepID=A0ACB9I6E4_9ASTR|nr:hypothetical protein L1987_31466 [Smallanthus sonchifolius]
MGRVAISSSGDVDFSGLMSHLLGVPYSRSQIESRNGESKGNIPVDVLDTPKEFVMYMDVPGLSKSEIQVSVEEENLVVVRSSGKRKPKGVK